MLIPQTPHPHPISAATAPALLATKPLLPPKDANPTAWKNSLSWSAKVSNGVESQNRDLREQFALKDTGRSLREDPCGLLGGDSFGQRACLFMSQMRVCVGVYV